MRWTSLTLLLFPFLSNAQAQDTFVLPEPQEQLIEPFALERAIASGPFTLTARLSLKELNRTAASVFIGERLNIGLDGRGSSFFVEGPAVGSVKTLAVKKGLIQAGTPFDFSVTRDADNQLVAKIGDNELHRMKFPGEVGQIRFRPHRNTMSVLSARLVGDLKPPPPLAELETRNVPVRTDGSAIHIADLKLATCNPVWISRLRVTVQGAPERVRSLAFGVEEKWKLKRVEQGAPPSGSAQFEFAAEPALLLEERPATLPLTLRVEPDAALDPPLELGIHVSFSTPQSWQDQPPLWTSHHLRLAAPLHLQGQFDCHTFRIPGLARSVKGTLLAVYDMRYDSRRDLQGHMDIGLSRSTDGGRTWSRPVPILDMGEYGGKGEDQNGVSDPNILVDERTGEILVAALWTHGKPGTHQWRGRGSEPGFAIGTTTQFMVTRSADDGKTWSKPENWTRKLKREEWFLFGPAPGNGITMRDGTLVMPTQGRDKTGLPFSNIMWSKDRGKTWTVSAHARDNTTECAVAECADGSLLLTMRDNRNRADKSSTNGRAMALTRDLGANWTVHAADRGALPEPVCMASMIGHTLRDGRRLLLFSNPNHKQRRHNMCIQTSLDHGVTWRKGAWLDDVGGAYSNLVMVDDDSVGLLYESSQADLLFQRVPLQELLAE